MRDYDDVCDESGALGDDYFINDDGELESMCPYCPIYRAMMERDEE